MWVKVDDKFPEHVKVLAAGQRLGRYGCGRVLTIWLLCACYANRNETDGVIPVDVVRNSFRLYDRAPADVAEAMAEPISGLDGRSRPGLLVRTAGGSGYRLHDYHDYQPSPAQRETIRAVRTAAGRRGGVRSGAARREARREANQEASCFAESKQTAEANANPGPDPDPVASEPEATSTARARGKTADTHRVSPHHVRAGHPRTHWYCGRNFCVSYLQHDMLESQLGAARDQVDLDACYPRWDALDPVIENLLPWLKARIAEDVGRIGRRQATADVEAQREQTRERQEADERRVATHETLARRYLELLTDEERGEVEAEARQHLADFRVRMGSQAFKAAVDRGMVVAVRQRLPARELERLIAARSGEEAAPAREDGTT